MPSDDILDLLGRYATGPLTEEERSRLFDAALNDQNLFEELAREQELKMLLQEPGARDRMIRALDAPSRRTAWILTGAVAAALSVVLIAFLVRPKQQQVAVARVPQAAAFTTPEPAPPPREVTTNQPQLKAKVQQPVPPSRDAAPAVASETAPVPAVAKTEEAAKAREVAKPAEVAKAEVAKKDIQTEAAPAPTPAAPAAPPPPPAAQARSARILPTYRAPLAQQNAVGGPKQNAEQTGGAAVALAQDQKVQAFGFHYSLATKGHLVIVPASDGYLFVKVNDGNVLFERKQIASAITTDIALPGGIDSIVITFSDNENPVDKTPTVRNEQSGNVDGSRNLAVQVKVPKS